MDRVVFTNKHGGSLVGHRYRCGADAVVVMAHGFCNDKDSDGRFPRIAEALNVAGLDALAFDFSGCGESDDARLTAAGMADDLMAAISWVRGEGYRAVGLFGNSLGGRICLMAADRDIAAMALTGAGTGPMHHDWLAYYGAGPMAEMATKGYLTDRVDSTWRGTVEVDRRMLDDFADIDPPSLLGAVACPVLMIHGNHPDDEEELALLHHARRALAWLPPSSRLEVIDGARHGFHDHLDQVIQLTVAWFRTYLEPHVGTD